MPFFYSVSASLLQNLVYPICRHYLLRLKGWQVTANPQLRHIRKPVLLAAAPHLSHMDVVLVPASVPNHLLPVRWLGDRKLFTGPLRTLWLKSWGAIPVARDRAGSFDRREIQWILDLALTGECIGVFPECCLAGGRFGDPQRDLIAAALEQNIAVLPVALSGNAGPQSAALLNCIDTVREVVIGSPLSDPAELLEGLAV